MSLNVTGLPGIVPNVSLLLKDCTPQLRSLDYATLKYIPSLPGNTGFMAIFIILLVGQSAWWLYRRTTSFTLLMWIGILLEIIGYSARINMETNLFVQMPFLTNIICLTIAPVFFTAAVYLTLSRLITYYGAHNSRLSPQTYILTFITSDILALAFQATGGGLAASSTHKSQSQIGINIMLVGLSVQVLSLAVFMVLAGEFFYRVRKDRKLTEAHNWVARKIERPPAPREFFQLFLWGYALSTTLLLVRSIFRVAELTHGFKGRLANNEAAFMVCEGGMVIFSCLIMTIFHPALFIGEGWERGRVRLFSKKDLEGELRQAEEIEKGEWNRGVCDVEVCEVVYMRPWPAHKPI
ncbi:RTA1 like protein-domain-containing protein [Tricladium varicosporioides]|nr:RTA1 like protein-domain-containing protein [Hymenoscyphus varicosporioides]